MATEQPPVAWQQPAEEEGPAPGIKFAGHGARLVAYIIDTIIVTALMIAVALVMGALVTGAAVSGSAGLAVGGGLLLVLAVIAVTFLYFPFFWARGGQTPGMKVFGIRIVRDRDGGPISGGQAFLRLLGYFVNGVVFYVGYVWILIDKRRRGWHDLIAGTVVIEDPRR